MTDERTTETWYYAGRRIAAGGKAFVYAWVDAEGEERYYGKLKTAFGQIGAAYTVAVTRDDDRVRVDPESLRFIDDKASHVAIEAWRVEDTAAYHQLESRKAEKRAAENDELQDALDVLRRHFTACKTYSSKWSFAQWVAAEVARPPKGSS